MTTFLKKRCKKLKKEELKIVRATYGAKERSCVSSDGLTLQNRDPTEEQTFPEREESNMNSPMSYYSRCKDLTNFYFPSAYEKELNVANSLWYSSDVDDSSNNFKFSERRRKERDASTLCYSKAKDLANSNLNFPGGYTKEFNVANSACSSNEKDLANSSLNLSAYHEKRPIVDTSSCCYSTDKANFNIPGGYGKELNVANSKFLF